MTESSTVHCRKTFAAKLTCLVSLVLVCSSPFIAAATQRPQRARAGAPRPTVLTKGKPVLRTLARGGVHHYQVKLSAGQYLRLTVDQRGIDVVLLIKAPDGNRIVEVDSPNGSQGPEPASIIAEQSGFYRLEVRSLEKKAASGRYQIKIEELRAATPQDKSRIAAIEAISEGVQLGATRTAEALVKAVEKYEQAARLAREAGDRKQEATALNNAAEVYYSFGETKKALDYFNTALSLFQAIGDRYGEASALSNAATVYGDLGEREKAIEYFRKALPIRKAVGDRLGEGISLLNLGTIFDSGGDKQNALEHYSQALAVFKAIKNRRGEATALNNIGRLHKDLGELTKALDYYNQSLAISAAIGDRMQQSTTLNNIAGVYQELGEAKKALELFDRSLSLAREAGDRPREARTLNNIGYVYDNLGDKPKALEYYNKALALLESVGDASALAYTLSNIGVTYESMGDEQVALDYFNKALPLLSSVGDRSGEATALANIGATYDALGEEENALDYYSRALALVRAIGERRSEAILLDNIAGIHLERGDRQKALELDTQALPIAQAAGDRTSIATILKNLGRAHSALGNRATAIDYFNQALVHWQAAGNPRGMASTVRNLGDSYRESGDNRKALEHYTQALKQLEPTGDQQGLAAIHYGIARAQRDLGNVPEARAHIETTLQIVESLRSRIRSRELRSSYFASVQDYYAFYIDLLMRHGPSGSEDSRGAAFEVSERARARSLLEMLAEARATIREGADPALLERERTIERLISSKVERQLLLLAGKHTAEQLAELKNEIEALRVEYQQVEADIRAKSPRYAALTKPEPLSVKEIQKQVLDSDTVLLEFSLGDERSYLWAVTTKSVDSYELPKRAEIESLARQFYELVTAPSRKQQTPAGGQQLASVANTLSRTLLGPVASRLGTKRLLIVADGALQYVPFSALPDPAEPKQPLIVKHEIVSLPSASTLAVIRRETAGRKPGNRTIAVLADPVFSADDGRVKPRNVAKETSDQQRGLLVKVQKAAAETGVVSAGLDLPRLPGTRREAEKILSLAPQAARMQAFDFAANRQTIAGGQLANYRMVHIATHGFLNSSHPELSGIVLSLVDQEGKPENGFLLAHEVYNLKLAADLVVLSACQTGLGKQVKGEGVVGLTRGLMYAGAARVVVSLWDVDDEATAELMVQFYSAVLKKRMRPSEALRAAQVALWKTNRWQAPYYWAAFTLQGEWK